MSWGFGIFMIDPVFLYWMSWQDIASLVLIFCIAISHEECPSSELLLSHSPFPNRPESSSDFDGEARPWIWSQGARHCGWRRWLNVFSDREGSTVCQPFCPICWSSFEQCHSKGWRPCLILLSPHLGYGFSGDWLLARAWKWLLPPFHSSDCER